MKRKTILLSAFVLLFVAILSRLGARDDEVWDQSLDKLSAMAALVDQNYFQAVEPDKMMQESVKGMLQTLDLHSYFLDPDGFSRMFEEQTSKYFGIGTQIQKQEYRLVVIAPIEGGPSWRLGVQPGDLITHINGESTKPITSQDAAGLETMDYLEFIARVTSHIPDKGQVMVRYYGLYANAHRGKVRKTVASPVTLSEEDRKPVPSNSRWTRSLSFFGVF